MSIINERKFCSACRGPTKGIINLPMLPLTGIYVSSPEDCRYAGFDQSFSLCERCGQGQLTNVIDPAILYDETYAHRSSQSPIARSGNDFFHEYLKELANGRRFKRVLEVGCNDIYLLSQLEAISDELIGIDPIWLKEKAPIRNKIRVIGGFIENFDIERDLGGRPDLVISAHTVEHIEDPAEQIRQLVNCASDDALFLIEVPSLDTLVDIGRFDQIFHQHLNYFSLHSFLFLIDSMGCSYIGHRFNFNYWGGTLLISFSKKRTLSRVPTAQKQNRESILRRFENFKNHLTTVKDSIIHLKDAGEKIVGFGAAQMFPILNYHMRDVCLLDVIYDDNTSRSGKYFPHMTIPIMQTPTTSTFEDKVTVVLALDSVRPIVQRLIDLKARRIIVPTSIY